MAKPPTPITELPLDKLPLNSGGGWSRAFTLMCRRQHWLLSQVGHPPARVKLVVTDADGIEYSSTWEP